MKSEIVEAFRRGFKKEAVSSNWLINRISSGMAERIAQNPSYKPVYEEHLKNRFSGMGRDELKRFLQSTY